MNSHARDLRVLEKDLVPSSSSLALFGFRASNDNKVRFEKWGLDVMVFFFLKLALVKLLESTSFYQVEGLVRGVVMLRTRKQCLVSNNEAGTDY